MEKFKMSFLTSKNELDLKGAIEGNRSYDLNAYNYCVFVFLTQSNQTLINYIKNIEEDIHQTSGENILVCFLYRDSKSRARKEKKFTADKMNEAMSYFNIEYNKLPCICIVDKTRDEVKYTIKKLHNKISNDAFQKEIFDIFQKLNNQNDNEVAKKLLEIGEGVKEKIKNVEINDLLKIIEVVKLMFIK
jgi:hypothetical protein